MPGGAAAWLSPCLRRCQRVVRGQHRELEKLLLAGEMPALVALLRQRPRPELCRALATALAGAPPAGAERRGAPPRRALHSEARAPPSGAAPPGAAPPGARPFPVVLSAEPADGKVVTATLGIVTSTSVLSANLATDVLVAIMGIFGGPVRQYEDLVSDATVRAIDGVAAAAQRMGGDQVTNLRIEKAVLQNR